MKYNPFLIQAQHRERVSELSKRGIVSPLAEQLAQYGENMLIHLEGLTWEEAHFLRQTMQACGGEAIFSGHPGDELEALLLATRSQLELALQRLSNEEQRMYAAAEEIREALAMREQLDRRRRLVCGPHVLPLGERTLVMGILNVTPDSFSDGGRYIDLDQAVAQARHMVEAGADLIDIGGESTRPGSEPVDAAEEMDRVLPIIRALSTELQVPLSIDTYKAEVADRAVQAGAHIINDIWGAKRDKRMAEVAARHQVPIILMHNREDRNYQHFFANFVKDLRESVQIALQAGVRHDQIILDPGIGFAKSLEQNLETMRRLDDLVGLGFPVLLATSRKSMIGHVLDLPVDERMEGTAATVALGVAKGCHMVRVHDVKEMKRVTTMMDAMVKGGVHVG
ncbi:dihydropteroate synthase [Brevibacillus panacihumi W25]|uniref:Dihydropteroate synthase n=1 Tax=Brevibacillus panacihumi W25 TaxID=1408254 RepID=V6M8L0_9BACL|nr:dihydropteroate synthase [Brevibacillus panacihumi]EST51673.1 dihydropteroate synthase [Brevibacillus panacihumi W25]